jgi:hypothetical protein
MIPNTRKILYPAATNQYNGVFLKVVTDTGNIGCDLDPISESNPGDLPQC